MMGNVSRNGTIATVVMLLTNLVLMGQGPPNLEQFAPDSRIFFTSDRVGFPNFDIFSIRPDGTELTRLTFDPGHDSPWQASPDGQKLLFRRRASGAPAPDLWIMNADGSDQQLVAAEAGTARWSPDGSLIYAMLRMVTPAGNESWLYSMNPDGSDLTFIFKIGNYCTGGMSISPDESTLVCGGTFDVFSLDLGDLSVTRLTDFPGVDGDPAFSPDGEWIAIASEFETPGILQIYLMRPDGSDLTRVTYSNTIERSPTWSPLGDSLAIARFLPGWGLVTIDLETGEEVLLQGAPSHFAFEPTWGLAPSPASLEACQNGGWEIFGFDSQGSCLRFLKTGQDSRN